MSEPARVLARRSVKRLAAAADRLRARRPGVVVLLYHRVGRASSVDVDLETAVFDEQMARLAASGRVVTLGRALELLDAPDRERGGLERGDAVAVTFDDGTADFAETAVPVLVRHSVPATLYLSTAYVEDQQPFADGARPTSWTALADACGTGLVDVGSHTHRHRLLDRLPANGVAEELDRSRGLIEERLGRPAYDFAYPKGVPGSAAADRAVRERFRSAALAGTRVNRYGGTDRYRLARSPIQASDGMRWFEQKVAGGMALEDVARRVVNRVRYARLES